ncbi:MAG: glycosyltransferase family 2 protein [Acidobacteria bacterium]|nr:glycosyltransferase family 2 protein [Acidobacteriota bacterium]
MTLLVRDEEEILQHNLDYHLSRGVDFIVAMDNLSQDGTADILKFYEKKGVLKSIFQASDDYDQAVWVTEMTHLAIQDYGADWVIHTDADEFWWPNSQQSLKAIFDHIDSNIDGLIVQRHNFLLNPDLAQDLPFYDRMTHRQVASTNLLGRPLPPKVCHKGISGIKLNQGNHDFSVPGREKHVCFTQELCIFHFPIRAKSFFAHRIEQGGKAYARNKKLRPEVGITWRHLYEELKQGNLDTYYQKMLYSPSGIETEVNANVLADSRFQAYMHQIHKNQ